MSVNKCILVGNLGADPELRYTTSGKPVGDLRIATSRRFTNGAGEKQEDTQWHRVVVWGKQAESCQKYLSKGRQVYVEGRLQTRQWTDKDGNKRYTTEVVAERVQFLGTGNNNKTKVEETSTSTEDTSQQQDELDNLKMGEEESARTEQVLSDHREVSF